jgi:polar amino acid transport system ATP-binding protein
MTTPMVEATEVHKSFGHVEVLRGIDMTVMPGEVACIIGPSGSGKSTFLRCINHLERIDAGAMRVSGQLIGYRESGGKLHELRESEVARQRRDIGMVFQRFNLFPHKTALENVVEAVPGTRDRAAGSRRPLGQVRLLPLPALRRAAAAGGDRAGAGDEPPAHAVRRAHLGAGP